MMPNMITAEDMMRDIYQAETELRWFEQKYGVLSDIFYRMYQAGQLRDEDPIETQEYLEWAGWFDTLQDRRYRYFQAIEDRLKMFPSPLSLNELHINQLTIAV